MSRVEGTFSYSWSSHPVLKPDSSLIFELFLLFFLDRDLTCSSWNLLCAV